MGRLAKHKIALTAEGLKDFAPDPDAEVVWDNQLQGFGLRTRGVADTKRWAWIYKYTHHAERKPVKVTLGPFLALTPDKARDKAKGYEAGKLWRQDKRDADRADDRARRAEVEAEKLQRTRPTVALLWERYWAADGSRKKSGRHYQALWEKHLSPFFGATKVADVTPEMVEEFKATLRATPGACNRALAVLSVMMTKAVTWGWRKGCAPEHPIMRRAVARYDEKRVDFYFTEEELGRLLQAAEGYATGAASRTSQGRRLQRSEAYGLAVRFLAMTGARASEVMGAHWGQFAPLEDGRLLWTVEATNTKNGRPVSRALDAVFSGVLLAWKPKSLALTASPGVVKLGTPRWVFPQASRPTLPIKRLEGAWREIKKAAGVKAGRIHDLRHTAATHLRRQGVPLTTIQQQLGHATILTTQRYAHVLPEGVIETGDLMGGIGSRAVAAAQAKAKADVVQMAGAVLTADLA